jgi:hypothetical protein
MTYVVNATWNKVNVSIWRAIVPTQGPSNHWAMWLFSLHQRALAQRGLGRNTRPTNAQGHRTALAIPEVLTDVSVFRFVSFSNPRAPCNVRQSQRFHCRQILPYSSLRPDGASSYPGRFWLTSARSYAIPDESINNFLRTGRSLMQLYSWTLK